MVSPKLFIVLSALICIAFCDKTTVLTPKESTNPPAGLLILPGAYIGADRYIPLAQKIQNNSTYRLWVSTVGGWFGNLVNPLQIPFLINGAKKDMYAQGLPEDAPIFIAAHSLGGVFLDMYTRLDHKGIAGIILYGSYINKSKKLVDYPVPVLTLSGDMDGLCRLSRIALDFQQFSQFAPRTPVVLIPGMNHSQIASGAMPKNVINNDIVAELTYNEAHQQIAKITNAFMTVNGNEANGTKVSAAVGNMIRQHNITSEILSGYLQAVSMDNNGDKSWALMVQAQIASLQDHDYNYTLKGKRVSSAEILTTNPDIAKVNDKTVSITIPYHYDIASNILDESLIQVAPVQVLTVAATKHALEKYFPVSAFTNDTRQCNISNQVAMFTASQLLPKRYMSRYLESEKVLVFSSDLDMHSETEWMNTNIQWHHSGNQMIVVSPGYVSPDQNKYYCKALTLSRVVEYIMIDSLRPQ